MWPGPWHQKCALLTDGRFSGASHGIVIGHITPEAQTGGPIALVEDGDEVGLRVQLYDACMFADLRLLARCSTAGHGRFVCYAMHPRAPVLLSLYPAGPTARHVHMRSRETGITDVIAACSCYILPDPLTPRLCTVSLSPRQVSKLSLNTLY